MRSVGQLLPQLLLRDLHQVNPGPAAAVVPLQILRGLWLEYVSVSQLIIAARRRRKKPTNTAKAAKSIPKIAMWGGRCFSGA
jgi:hypothetical protein